MEKWKTLFNGRYKVSSYGKVVSVNYHREGREQELSPAEDKDGYLKVLIYTEGNGTRINIGVHRLVASAFIDNIDNKPEINHRDGNKKNNNVNNLEWVTSLENLEHSYKYLGRSNAQGHESKCAKEFLVTSPEGVEMVICGLNAFCKAEGLLQGEMSNVVTGRAKSHKGWKCKKL